MSDERDAKVVRVGACQLVMVSAAEALGFTVQETAAAALFTAAGAFAASDQPNAREAFLALADRAFDLCEAHIATLSDTNGEAMADILAKMDPQGGVS